MKNLRQPRLFLLAIFGCLTLGAQCDGLPTNPSTSPVCDVGTAQIAVWDGFLQNVCGCGGTPGAILPANSPLTCTFSLGHTLYIYFNGKLMHQVVPVGTPAFAASSVYNPRDAIPIRVFAYAPPAAGSYGFKDLFEGELGGTIVVTP